MTIPRRLLLLSLLWLTAAVLPIPVPAAVRTVTLLHTSDVHTHLTRDQAARLAAVIDRECQRAGGRDHVLLVDTGDTIQGTLSGAVTHGQIGVAFLNACHYQAWIPGNHDFEFGLTTLLDCRRAFTGDALAANLEFAGRRAFFADWKLYNVNDLKVALIGLTFPYRQQLSPPGELEFTLQPFRPTLERIIPGVMAVRPDVIVLGVHYGLSGSFEGGDNSLYSLAAAFPQIAVILGGHTHQIVPGKRVGNSWYDEPGKHGEGVGVTVIEWDPEQHRVTQVRSRFSPAAVIDRPPPGPDALRPLNQATHRFGMQPVGELHCRTTAGANLSFHTRLRTETLFTPLHRLVGEAALAATHAELAILSPSHLPNPLPNGTINEYDLFQLSPFEDELIVLPLTADDLRRILTEQFRLVAQSGKFYYFQAPYGLTAVYEAKTGILDDLQLPKKAGDNATYQTVFSGFALANAVRRNPELQQVFQQHYRQRRHTGINLRQALRDYLRQHSPITVENAAPVTSR